jgi:hypothetical protein
MNDPGRLPPSPKLKADPDKALSVFRGERWPARRIFILFHHRP